MAIGSLNWLSIGVLQYDFVAGLFGSQANVFSRIVYAIIGISAFFVCYALIKGKGKLKLENKIPKQLPNPFNNTQPQQSEQQHNQTQNATQPQEPNSSNQNSGNLT